MHSPAKDFFASTTALFQAIIYTVTNRWIWKYIFAAILINIIIFVSIASLFYFFVDYVLDYIFNFLTVDTWVKKFGFLLQIIIWLPGLFLFGFIFNTLSAILNSPIYSSLTEKVIEKEFGPDTLTNSSILNNILDTVRFELKKICLILIFFFSTSILNLVPFVGSIIFILVNWLLVSILFGLDIFDPYHGLKNFSFRRRLLEFSKRPFLYFPYSLGSVILSSIPLLNIFITPVSIVGAALIAKEKLGFKIN